MLMFIGSSFIYIINHLYFFISIFSMEDSKVLPTCLSLCEDQGFEYGPIRKTSNRSFLRSFSLKNRSMGKKQGPVRIAVEPHGS